MNTKKFLLKKNQKSRAKLIRKSPLFIPTSFQSLNRKPALNWFCFFPNNPTNPINHWFLTNGYIGNYYNSNYQNSSKPNRIQTRRLHPSKRNASKRFQKRVHGYRTNDNQIRNQRTRHCQQVFFPVERRPSRVVLAHQKKPGQARPPKQSQAKKTRTRHALLVERKKLAVTSNRSSRCTLYQNSLKIRKS